MVAVHTTNHGKHRYRTLVKFSDKRYTCSFLITPNPGDRKYWVQISTEFSFFTKCYVVLWKSSENTSFTYFLYWKTTIYLIYVPLGYFLQKSSNMGNVQVLNMFTKVETFGGFWFWNFQSDTPLPLIQQKIFETLKYNV